MTLIPGSDGELPVGRVYERNGHGKVNQRETAKAVPVRGPNCHYPEPVKQAGLGDDRHE